MSGLNKVEMCWHPPCLTHDLTPCTAAAAVFTHDSFHRDDFHRYCEDQLLAEASGGTRGVQHRCKFADNRGLSVLRARKVRGEATKSGQLYAGVATAVCVCRLCFWPVPAVSMRRVGLLRRCVVPGLETRAVVHKHTSTTPVATSRH